MGQDLQSEKQGQAHEARLSFTDKAVEVIQQAMQQKGMRGGGIRMTVAGGGAARS